MNKCYECRYRRDVSGSAHSQCSHPSLNKVTDDPLLQVLGIFASVGRVSPINISNKELNIKADPHGVKMGWFNFPFNFDPLWLLNCDGFQEVLNKRPKMKIKQLLLEQKLIAGVGNIYAQEACFMAGILPMRQVKSLMVNEVHLVKSGKAGSPPAEFNRVKKLYQAIKKVLSEAIKYGGSSAENYLNLYGKEGDFVPRLKVYGRGGEKCRRCGSILKTIRLGGRGTVFCGVCQK